MLPIDSNPEQPAFIQFKYVKQFIWCANYKFRNTHTCSLTSKNGKATLLRGIKREFRYLTILTIA